MDENSFLSKHEQTDTFSYVNPNRSATNISADKMANVLKTLTSSIINAKVSERDLNNILKSCLNFAEGLNEFNLSLLECNNDMTAKQVLQITTKFTRDKIRAVNSKYKRKNNIKSSKSYVPPKEIAIGTRWETCKVKKNDKMIVIPRLIQSVFYYISIKQTLGVIFDNKDFAAQYFDYNVTRRRDHVCVPDEYHGFCCGSTFKSMELFNDYPESIQLQIGYDEYDPCNGLGSKSNRHKTLAVYLSIQNLPAKYLSKCKYIFLVALCNGDDIKMKHTDFNNIWYPIVNEIKDLETNGIDVQDNRVLKGTLTSIASDNLGAHQGLGFVKSFASTYFCRFCISSRNQCISSIEENESESRTIENYEEQLEIVEESTKVKFCETKGVAYYCLLSELTYFHIISHPSVDIMHDINEGAVPFALKLLFNQIVASKIMNLSELSLTVQMFDYGFLNRRNIPSPIDVDKRSLGQNAAQSICLARNIPFVLWSYRNHVDLQDNWKCIGALLRVIVIAYSRVLTKQHLTQLRAEIKLFSSKVIEIGGRLIPKIHFMQHYPRIIEMMGPIIYMNMMRYERKHKELKNHIANSFKNVNKIVATKHQELLAIHGVSHHDDVQIGFTKPVNEHFFKDILVKKFGNDISVVNELKSLKLNNYDYRKGLFITENSKLHQIMHIFSHTEFYLLLKTFDILSFEKFLNSFQVKEKEVDEFYIIDINSLRNPKTYEGQYKESKLYIKAETLDMHLHESIE